MPMKLKIQHLMDATLVLTQLIRRECPLPQKGNYRVARMHTKLNAEFLRLNAERDEMIKAYNTPMMVENPAYKLSEDGSVANDAPKMIPSLDMFVVPDADYPEFQKRWEDFAKEEIEVDVEPIPLDQLCFADPNLEGTITPNEFIVLGDLVKE